MRVLTEENNEMRRKLPVATIQRQHVGRYVFRTLKARGASLNSAQTYGA